MMKYHFSILLCLLSLWAIAQEDRDTFKELMSKVRDTYAAFEEGYRLDYSYAIYTDKNAKEPQEKYKGRYLTNQRDVYSQVGPIELLRVKNTLLQIDNEGKVFVYSQNQDSAIPNPLQLEDQLALYEVVSVRKREQNNGWICVLEKPKAYIEGGADYVKIEINENYTLQSQQSRVMSSVVFSGVDASTDVIAQPFIKTVFQAPQSLKDEQAFQLAQYVIQEGTTIKPQQSYKNYEFIIF